MNFNADETITLGPFRASTGKVDPTTTGMVVETKDGEDILVATSFGNTLEIAPSQDHYTNVAADTNFTTAFEGPLVKLWWDTAENPHLSTTKNLDCSNSYWGNKQERFGPLFHTNGGQAFIDAADDKTLTHHFMIMTPSLLVTSELDLVDNDCVVVYLGSMTRDFNFVMLECTDELFVQQPAMEIIPPKAAIDGKLLYPFVATLNDINILNRVYSMVEFGINPAIVPIFRPLTEDEACRGVNMPLLKSYFGNPVIVRDSQAITKFVPHGYSKKCGILGNSPNVKLMVYQLMDSCRPKRDIANQYFQDFDFLFVPSTQFLSGLKDSDNVKRDIALEYREQGTVGFTKAKDFRNNLERERNLLLVILLCLPQSKAYEAIKAYEEYTVVRKNLQSFIKFNTTKILNGGYDSETNARVTTRLKDMASRATSYSISPTAEGQESSYNQGKFNFSLRGLVMNERGGSLYKIEREMKTFVAKK